MRIYLELYELPEGFTEEADFIRIDVTGWSQSDIDTAIRLLKEHAQIYKHYVIQMHYCFHEENKPCNVVILDTR